MNRWLDPLLAAFERTPDAPAWFFRDDDAGWADQRMLAVAGVFQRSGVVLDVAAIPAAVSPKLAEGLRALVAAGAVAVHQHGWAHVNHQRDGRRSEFGTARTPAEELRELRKGRSVLAGLLEGAVEPFFTPPWNRCQDRTVPLLTEVGLTVLSCDVSAPRRNVPGVAEVPVRVDWARCWREGGPERLGAELARALHELGTPIGGGGRAAAAPRARAGDIGREPGNGAPALGVMLHHATMTGDQLDTLASLLGTLSARPSAVLTSMGVLGAASSDIPQPPHHTVGSGIGTRSLL